MWTEEEDEELRGFVAEYGVKKWAFISTKMSTGKGAKQCRRRWQNYLNNDLKQGGWTEEEDQILLDGHRLHGNKWTEIARMVGGRTDNAVKNRHAVLVLKEQKKDEDDSEATGSRGGKRKRNAGGANDSDSRKAKKSSETSSAAAAAAAVGSWRPNLSVKIPSSSSGGTGAAAGSNLPSSAHTSAPPSLEGMPSSASLTAAEIELLKQVQELISPRAEGLTLPTSARRGGAALASTANQGGQPHSPLDTPTVDLQQVMNWIMSVTPRAAGGASAAPAQSQRSTRGQTLTAATAEMKEEQQGQHSALLRKLLTEKLSGSPTGSPAARRSPRSAHTPVGLEIANAVAAAGGLPTSPNFTSSELNLLMNALGGGGDSPTSGLVGGINPFGRASDSIISQPAKGKDKK
jgi:hypothetical protein